MIDSYSPPNRGEMAEWLKAHAWKACLPQGNVGSNPTLSAIQLFFPMKIRVARWRLRQTEPFEGVRRGSHARKVDRHDGLWGRRGSRVEATVLS